MSANPNYQIFSIDLTNAGQMDIQALYTYLRMVSAKSGVNTALSALVNVLPRRTGGDAIPMQLNGLVEIPQQSDFVRVSWDAQPGITVKLFMSDEDSDKGIKVEAPPTTQIITSSFGNGFTYGKTAVGVAAVLVAPALATRQSVTISADKANTGVIYVGSDNALTAANGGAELAAGEVITIDRSTGDVWCIASVAAQNVRVIVES